MSRRAVRSTFYLDGADAGQLITKEETHEETATIPHPGGPLRQGFQ